MLHTKVDISKHFFTNTFWMKLYLRFVCISFCDVLLFQTMNITMQKINSDYWKRTKNEKIQKIKLKLSWKLTYKLIKRN